MAYDPEDPRTFVGPKVWEGHRLDRPARGGIVVRVRVLELSDDSKTATVIAEDCGTVTRQGEQFTVPASSIAPWWEDVIACLSDSGEHHH
ncbi:hypothetical protein [Streptomyces sp. NBC_01304]|uniref:hypothetical protein n=1 Tax=Streptomyces sp. NBC_01304 TaxID=2903818 RepID=UPI002E0F3A06|nr:hypothetical protein OG430_48920 [Streptomyces sp. NBC_01304]